MSDKYDDDILDSLTDEERAALMEDDDAQPTNSNDDGNGDEDPGADGNEGEAETTGGDDADKEGDDAGEGDGNGGNAGDDAGADDAAEGKPESRPDPKTAADTAAPLLIAEAPEDAEAQLKEIADGKVSLAEKFDNGDITAKEYQTQLDELNRRERAVERAIDKARLAAEMRQQQEINAWLGQVREFTTVEHPEYSQSRVRWMALDAFVKEIGSKPENANLSGPEILRMAHERVVADLGDAAVHKPQADGRPLKGPKAEAPKTLAKVPAADNAGLEDSRWAALDRLRETDPLAHEDALMKLSEKERDEYLARA